MKSLLLPRFSSRSTPTFSPRKWQIRRKRPYRPRRVFRLRRLMPNRGRVRGIPVRWKLHQPWHLQRKISRQNRANFSSLTYLPTSEPLPLQIKIIPQHPYSIPSYRNQALLLWAQGRNEGPHLPLLPPSQPSSEGFEPLPHPERGGVQFFRPQYSF